MPALAELLFIYLSLFPSFVSSTNSFLFFSVSGIPHKMTHKGCSIIKQELKELKQKEFSWLNM